MNIAAHSRMANLMVAIAFWNQILEYIEEILKMVRNGGKENSNLNKNLVPQLWGIRDSGRE